MMRADWFVTLRMLRCGGCCGEFIAPNAPVRRLRYGGYRCAPCAKALLGEDVPADLPTAVPGPTLQDRLDALTRRLEQEQRTSALDFKARAAGDDGD